MYAFLDIFATEMLGTIVNTACIVVGTLVGTLFKKGLGAKYSDALFNAMSLASLALGIGSFVMNMPKANFRSCSSSVLPSGAGETALDRTAG